MPKLDDRFGEPYAPFVQTKRFDIFRHRVVRNPEQGLPRDLFTAWYRDEDVPRSVCEVVLFIYPHGIYVEWVHVCARYRRKGVATEVLTALQNKWGPLSMSGITDAGEKFVAAYNRKNNKKPKPTNKNTNRVKRVTRKRN